MQPPSLDIPLILHSSGILEAMQLVLIKEDETVFSIC